MFIRGLKLSFFFRMYSDSYFESLKEEMAVYGDIERERKFWCTDYNVFCSLNFECKGPRVQSCPAFKDGRKLVDHKNQGLVGKIL